MSRLRTSVPELINKLGNWCISSRNLAAIRPENIANIGQLCSGEGWGGGCLPREEYRSMSSPVDRADLDDASQFAGYYTYILVFYNKYSS